MANFESKLGSIMTYVDGIPFIKMKDAIDLAREADAALASLQEKVSFWFDERNKAHALNVAKGELIDFYANYIGKVTTFLDVHSMGASKADVAEGERLRARIRSLENES